MKKDPLSLTPLEMKVHLCLAKHTHPQIPDEDWRCPNCGATAKDDEGFFVEEPAAQTSDACELLHERDGVYCWKCKYSTTGKKLAAAYVKQKALAPCAACRGTGYVQVS